MIDVVILNYNDYSTVIKHITNINKFENIRKILIVDNLSTDNSYNILKKYTNNKILLISSRKNGGYGYGNNVGIRYLYEKYNSKYILLANPDVIYSEETISSLYNFLVNNKDYAIVAPFMLDKHNNKQYNTAFRIPKKWEYILSLGIVIQKFIKPFYYKNIENEKIFMKQVGAVAGSMFLMDANVMYNDGMYDENIFLYCEEIVLGLKMERSNHKIGLMVNESFVHDHSTSINKSIKSEIKKRRILIKSKLFVIRNYYSINLIEYFIAIVISKISLFEYKILCSLKKEVK